MLAWLIYLKDFLKDGFITHEQYQDYIDIVVDSITGV